MEITVSSEGEQKTDDSMEKLQSRLDSGLNIIPEWIRFRIESNETSMERREEEVFQ